MLKDGYFIKENVFSQAECDQILTSILKFNGNRSRAGIRNLMSCSGVASLANDDRLLDLVSSYFGNLPAPFKATLFEKTGKANWLVSWHQDTALPVERVPDVEGWGPISVKEGVTFAHAPTSALAKIFALRIHLDASDEANGPLRVIPGSHKKRFHDDAQLQQILGKEVVCTVGRGGVIGMSPLILHASSKATSDKPRRVLHIEYAESLQIEPRINLAIA